MPVYYDPKRSNILDKLESGVSSILPKLPPGLLPASPKETGQAWKEVLEEKETPGDHYLPFMPKVNLDKLGKAVYGTASAVASAPGLEFIQPLQIGSVLGKGKKLFPSALNDLASEAKKYSKFEDFEKSFLGQIKHGTYYHVTDNPNFTIDPKLGPRDMSSMASGKMTPGKLMTTSHLENWAGEYPERQYVAILDFSNVDPKNYYQVNRGFGNEFMVLDPSQVKVKKVVPIKEALKYDKKIQNVLDKEISSSDKLKDFFNKVNSSVESVK